MSDYWNHHLCGTLNDSPTDFLCVCCKGLLGVTTFSDLRVSWRHSIWRGQTLHSTELLEWALKLIQQMESSVQLRTNKPQQTDPSSLSLSLSASRQLNHISISIRNRLRQWPPAERLSMSQQTHTHTPHWPACVCLNRTDYYKYKMYSKWYLLEWSVAIVTGIKEADLLWFLPFGYFSIATCLYIEH